MISYAEFAERMLAGSRMIQPELDAATKELVALGVTRAKSYIGHQQEDWEPLADSTKSEKQSLGFAPPDYEPLLRTGEMRDSIEGNSIGTVGEIGSNNQKAVWQEFGTVHIPPRPFISKAVQSLEPDIALACESVAAKALGGV